MKQSLTPAALAAGLAAGLAATLLIPSTAMAQAACSQGYVWRESTASDLVCVPPATRAQAARDNRLAGARREPGGGAYGPKTCRQGYVWREATRGDVVCVTPDVRAQAAADNAAAASRQAGRRIAQDRPQRFD